MKRAYYIFVGMFVFGIIGLIVIFAYETDKVSEFYYKPDPKARFNAVNFSLPIDITKLREDHAATNPPDNGRWDCVGCNIIFKNYLTFGYHECSHEFY
ncbi:hypothetical protein LCGC14_1946960 [marine sediment metagenome]|uniref:Uncharacterized protein n=1 Tax=marine sediment metagenome TaxID=412755 RepID=A0A0F9HWY0_9ZZZZ